MTKKLLHAALMLVAFSAYADSATYKPPMYDESVSIPKGQHWFGCRTTKGYKIVKWYLPPKLEQVERFEKIGPPMIADQDKDSVKECAKAIRELKEGIKHNQGWSKEAWFIKTEAPGIRCCF